MSLSMEGLEGAIIEHVDGVPLIRIRKALWKPPRQAVKEKRPIWTSEEITKMLKIMKEKNILSLLYGGKYRKNDVFKVVAANLRKVGYIRTAEQISTKWKHLRLTYAHAKAESKSGNLIAKQQCAYYGQMDDLLGDKIHIIGVDNNTDDKIEPKTRIETQEVDRFEPTIETEILIGGDHSDYTQVDFSQVEVIQTEAIETDVSLIEENLQSSQKIEFQGVTKLEPAIETEIFAEGDHSDYTQVEVMQTEAIETDVSLTGENLQSNQRIEFQDVGKFESVVETEIFAEGDHSDYTQVDFSQVEVVQTEPYETDVSLPGPSGQEAVTLEVEESYEEQLEYPQGVDSETTTVETSPQKKTRKKRMFRNPPGRLRKSNEGTYSNALKNFTKEWELMMLRVAEKEREQDRLEKEREKAEQRRWEERLIEQQSEAMTNANSEFLMGLKGLFDELKK